jgi:hypothetical protein
LEAEFGGHPDDAEGAGVGGTVKGEHGNPPKVMIVVGFENDALILRALLPFFEKRIPG